MEIRTYGESIDFGGSIIGVSDYRIIDLEESEESEEKEEEEEEERGGGGGDST